MNKRKIGAEYEHRAEKYLSDLGMEIACRNFRTRFGEIDLIMTDNTTLVFIEVKFRAANSAGNALEAINLRKRLQIVRIARQFLSTHKEFKDMGIRFDCVGINGDSLSYIRNAFDIKGNIT